MARIRQIAVSAACVLITSTAGLLAANPASATGADCPWNSPVPCLTTGTGTMSPATADDCPWNSPTPCLPTGAADDVQLTASGD